MHHNRRNVKQYQGKLPYRVLAASEPSRSRAYTGNSGTLPLHFWICEMPLLRIYQNSVSFVYLKAINEVRECEIGIKFATREHTEINGGLDDG